MSDIFLPENGVAGGYGYVTNKTQRVTIATNDINMAAINTNIATINTNVNSLANNNESFSETDVSVGSGDYTVLATITSGTYKYIGVEIESDAASAAALSELILQVKDNASGSWYSMIGNDDWIDSANPILIFATSSPRPDQVDAGETAHFRVKINKAYSVRIVAKTAANTAIITCRGYAA